VRADSCGAHPIEEPGMAGRRDAGQASMLLVGVVAIAVVLLLALVPVAAAVRDSARARSAADAAALAGAAEGEAAAREVARDNGARVIAWEERGGDVWIEVTVGGAHARSKAHRG
jgi:hypothetical protein